MRQTNSLVLKMFGWAGDYETNKGVDGALAARMKQARAFSEEVDKMQLELRKFTSSLSKGEDFVDRQLLLFANCALGSTVSRAAIKAMAKQDEWRETIDKRYGSDKKQDASEALATKLCNAISTGFQKIGASGGGSSANPRSSGGGNNDRGSGGGGGSGNGHGGGGRRDRQDESTKAPPPKPMSGNAKILGLTAVTAMAILGTNIKGAVDKHLTCTSCNEQGHDPIECPRLFATTFPGRSIPGWHEDGTKNNSCWDGDKCNPNGLRQWLAMQKLGFFTKDPRSGRAAEPYRFI
jgi:hypothetical protein